MHLCLCVRGEIAPTVCSATVGFMAVIPSLSVVHGKVCPGDRTGHLDRHTLGCNLQVLCHNKCWTVLGEWGGAGQHRCGEVCVSVCVCAKFSLKPILEMPFLLFMTEEKLWSQRHFQGRACAGNLTCAQLCVHVLLTCVFSHRFAFRCATSRFLWNPLWNPLSSPRKLATSFPTWRVWLSSCVKTLR